MEIKKRFDLRVAFVTAYFVAFATYVAIGLAPAEAVNYEISAELAIPTIGLKSDVTTLRLRDFQLDTPQEIVGSFTRDASNTLLIGHVSTVFRNLEAVQIGDEIIYDDGVYVVQEMQIVPKDNVNMNELLAAQDRKTLTIMTCAGDEISDGDTTERLILTAI